MKKSKARKGNGENGDLKSVIQLSTKLNDDLAACVKALIASPHVEIFQRGGQLVMRSAVKGKTHDGKEVMDKAIALHCSETLRVALATAANFEKWNDRKKEYVRCYPPSELASALLKCEAKDFPILRGLIGTPTLRADGTILDEPGYDAATGLYYDPQGVDFGQIPEQPTKEDALAALDELKALICEFPFVDEPSRAVALARLLNWRFTLDA